MAIAEAVQRGQQEYKRKPTPIRSDFYSMGKEMFEDAAQREGLTPQEALEDRKNPRSIAAIWNFLYVAEILEIGFRQVELGKILHMTEQNAGKHRMKVRIAIREQMDSSQSLKIQEENRTI